MFVVLVTAVDPRLIVVAALTRFVVAAVVVISPPLTEISPGIFDYLYSWTGPNSFTSTSKSIVNLNVGTYEVTVIDKLGCTLKRTIIIDQPSSKIEIDVTKSDVSCYGETDGSIDIASRSFSWFLF